MAGWWQVGQLAIARPYREHPTTSQTPHWGTERIRGELLKLGIAVSARSIRRHRRRGPSRPPSQSWCTFLANHAQAIWAADLFVVQTLTFQTLYVFFLISHDRRRLLHFDVTRPPDRRLGLAPDDRGHALGPAPQVPDPRPRPRLRRRLRHPGRRPRRRERPNSSSITRANATAERVVRSLRRECLDHILPLSEGHVRSVLAEFVSYYNQDRPHRSLGLETPVPSLRQVDGEVVSRPVLNGLHHVYARAA